MRRKPSSWIFWVPVLLVGAVIYWTVALGAAGISLLAIGATGNEASQSDDATRVESTTLPVEGMLPNEDPIPVRLLEEQESADPRPSVSPTAVEPMPGS